MSDSRDTSSTTATTTWYTRPAVGYKLRRPASWRLREVRDNPAGDSVEFVLVGPAPSATSTASGDGISGGGGGLSAASCVADGLGDGDVEREKAAGAEAEAEAGAETEGGDGDGDGEGAMDEDEEFATRYARAPRVSVTIEDLTGNPMVLNDFTKFSQANLEAMLGHKVDIDDISLGGQSGHCSIYFSDEPDEGLTIGFYQAWTVKHDQAFILTYIAVSSNVTPDSPSDFQRHLELAKECISSLDLSDVKQRYKPLWTSFNLVPYYNLENMFMIRVPEGWPNQIKADLDTNCCDKIVADFKSVVSLSTDPHDVGVLIKISIHVSQLAAPLSLNQYTRLITMQYDQMQVSQLNITDVNVNGIQGMASTFDTSLLAEGHHFMQWWAIQGNKAFTLTFGSTSSCDIVTGLCSRVLNSFNWIAEDDDVDQMTTYNNLHYGLSIPFPSNYDIEEGFRGTTVSFIGKHESLSEPPNLNVIVKDFSKLGIHPPSLDDLMKQIKEQVKLQSASFGSAKQFSTRDTQLVGVPAKELTYILSNKESATPMKFLQCFAVKDGRTVFVSFMCAKRHFEEIWKQDKIGLIFDSVTLEL
ncbi:hypothetical protein Pelo_2983 [Pelomyxa schiedti]|nr:hypothetical protein Pelo_2983 [Pelomyxa schiedti]